MNRIEEIDRRIAELKSELERVEGTPTEVYSRIVGYYRPVKNWNKGKREEFTERASFTTAEERAERIKDPPHTDREEHPPAYDRITDYLYFFRSSCPNCPPVATALKELGIPGSDINVDTDEGFSEARAHNVLASPTVIFLDREKYEVFRGSTAEAVRKVLSTISEEVPV